MKSLLALALVAVMAGSALADAPEVGLYFSNTEFTQETVNFAAPLATPFSAYIALTMSDLTSVGAYEVGISHDGGSALLITGASGPNGWTNFGNNLNHLAGYQTPLPVNENGTVLGQVDMLLLSPSTVVFTMHGANPPSVPGHDGPVLADGQNSSNLVVCWTPAGAPNGEVASLNGEVVAVEQNTLTGVKALFE